MDKSHQKKMSKRNWTLKILCDTICMKFWEKQISQGSSYLNGWGIDWKETRDTS